MTAKCCRSLDREREKSEKPVSAIKLSGFDLALDWFPNPDHLAIYEAIKEGYFRDVGLDVKPHVPSDPAAPIKQVAAGRVDLAISYEPEVFLARQQGLPVVAVAALVQRPLTSLIATRKSHVKSVGDLRGKRVGTAGIPYQSAYLKTILRRASVPESSVKVTNVVVSADRLRVTLSVDNLMPGRIYELRPGSILSSSGERLITRLAAYTVNRLKQ